MKISISYSSGYKSTCYPIYYTSDPTLSLLNSVNINFSATGSPWGYIRCSVDITNKLYFHFDETLTTSEFNLTGNFSTIPVGNSSLIFQAKTSNNNLTNQGALFIKQMRLWNCYLCQDADTYRFEITNITATRYTNLLYLFESPYIVPEKITDVKANLDYTINLNVNWIGYNVFDLTNYTILSSSSLNGGNSYLCSEFKDVCSGLVKLNQLENLTFSSVTAPMNSRYTLELWVMTTSAVDLISGISFIWKNNASVSIIRDSTINGTINSYCWPQDYRVNLQTLGVNVNINSLTGNTLNYDYFQTVNNINTWIWIRCEVDYNDKVFYLSDNAVKTLKADTVYGGVTNDNPLRYFWQNNETSNFHIWGGAANISTNIFARSIYLFNEFIPKGYSFKYG